LGLNKTNGKQRINKSKTAERNPFFLERAGVEVVKNKKCEIMNKK
jgi:hypothetical protein